VLRTVVLKSDTVGIIPTGDYRLGNRQLLKPCQLGAYIGSTRKNVTHVCKGRDIYLARVRSLKVEGYFAESRSFNNWDVLARVSMYGQSSQTHC
jgi:hypothetical protein